MPHGLEDTKEALFNMALAAVLDKETIASQTRIIESLTETILPLTAQLSGENRATENGQSSKWVNGNYVLDRGSYCWSHGYYVDPTHNSGTCTKKKNGHKLKEKRDNTLGGCAYGNTKSM